MAEGQLNFARESQNPPRETVSGQTADTTAGPTAETQGEPALVIENDSDLPDTYPRGVYGVRLRVRGGVVADARRAARFARGRCRRSGCGPGRAALGRAPGMSWRVIQCGLERRFAALPQVGRAIETEHDASFEWLDRL